MNLELAIHIRVCLVLHLNAFDYIHFKKKIRLKYKKYELITQRLTVIYMQVPCKIAFYEYIFGIAYHHEPHFDKYKAFPLYYFPYLKGIMETIMPFESHNRYHLPFESNSKVTEIET